MAITFRGGQSYFKPLTFDEMMKPLIYYAEAYDKADADLSELSKQTEYWRSMVNRENSPEAFEMYNRYSAELNNYVEAMSRGDLRSVQSNLLRMKGRYGKDIQPIENAYNTMKEANDLRDKAGPDAIFEVNRYNSIDQFLHGDTANNRYQSKEALTKKAAAVSQAAMEQMANDPEVKEIIGNNQYLQSIIHNGGSYEDLQKALAQAIDADPILGNKFSEIRQDLLKNSGYERYDSLGQQAIVDAVDLGMYNGLDKPVRNLIANGEYRSAADRDASARGWAQINLAREELNDKRRKEQDAIYGTLLGVDPDGTEHWGNNVSTWDKTPIGETQKKTSDGRYVYKDSNGKIYYANNKGKVVINDKGEELTPVMETKYETKMNTTSGDVIPETDANGEFTGRYWNTKLKKYVSEDGYLTQQSKYKDNIDYTPLFFSAWSKGASSAFQIQDARTNKGMLNDWGQVSWESIHGGEAKATIKNYVKHLAGLPDNFELPDEVMKNIAQHIVIERDQNWVYDNNFAVHIKGVDDEGKIVNQTEFERAKKAIKKELSVTVDPHKM